MNFASNTFCICIDSTCIPAKLLSGQCLIYSSEETEEYTLEKLKLVGVTSIPCQRHNFSFPKSPLYTKLTNISFRRFTNKSVPPHRHYDVLSLQIRMSGAHSVYKLIYLTSGHCIPPFENLRPYRMRNSYRCHLRNIISFP